MLFFENKIKNYVNFVYTFILGSSQQDAEMMLYID